MRRSLLSSVLSLSVLLSTLVRGPRRLVYVHHDQCFSGTTATVANGINNSG